MQPALSIMSLNTSTTTFSMDTPFRVAVGVPSSNNSGISEYQAVRVGGTGVTATIVSSDSNVGQLITSTTTGGTVTVDIASGQAFSPSTVATGGVAFHPLTSGATTVSATIPDFIATTEASVNVNVTP